VCPVKTPVKRVNETGRRVREGGAKGKRRILGPYLPSPRRTSKRNRRHGSNIVSGGGGGKKGKKTRERGVGGPARQVPFWARFHSLRGEKDLRAQAREKMATSAGLSKQKKKREQGFFSGGAKDEKSKRNNNKRRGGKNR